MAQIPSYQHGVVAAGDQRTAQAGLEVLQAGGNAVDAAVASVFAAFAAEPVLTGPFGGGFAAIGTPGGQTVVYDLFANVPGRGLPRALDLDLDFQEVEVSFGPTTQIFHVGRGSVSVTPMLPGLRRLHAEHGRLPLGRLIEPAQALCRRGVPLTPQIAMIVELLDPILRLTPASAALYAPGGRLLRSGDRFFNPDLVRCLEQVGAGEIDGLQARLLEIFGPPHGLITAADLDGLQIGAGPALRVPVGQDWTVALTPPPSSGGLLVGFGLRLLEHVDAAVWRDELDTYRHLLGVMEITQRVRAARVDDAISAGGDAVTCLARALLSDDFVDRWRAPFDRAVREPLAPTSATSRSLGSTTHVGCIDREGWACSITSSNGEGCGHLVPGTGCHANNFMGEADLHPNGFHSRPAGAHLTSMMCPTLVLRDGRPALALGSGGSNRIRTAILQVLVHHLLGGRSLEAAVLAPRIHFEGGDLFVEVQTAAGPLATSTLGALAGQVSAPLVCFERPNIFFGGVHVCARSGEAAGDPRRGGAVALS